MKKDWNLHERKRDLCDFNLVFKLMEYVVQSPKLVDSPPSRSHRPSFQKHQPSAKKKTKKKVLVKKKGKANYEDGFRVFTCGIFSHPRNSLIACEQEDCAGQRPGSARLGSAQVRDGVSPGIFAN
ncbi:hypothetical protein ACLOJK_027066 [Asimina triloba]